MKIFTLNDKIVRHLRANHPMLKGAKLIGSGQFSGVFECTESTILKLSIDEASYLFHKSLNKDEQHFAKIVNDFGIVGTFETSRNVATTAVSNPVRLKVPIYLYEVEKLEKIPAKTDNRQLALKLSKDWRSLDHTALCSSRQMRMGKIVQILKDNAPYLAGRTSIVEALEALAEFAKSNSESFVDFHGANMMQRNDGTFIFSDPIGDLRIYNGHYALQSVSTAKVA